MGLILAAIGFLALTFVAALVRNDAVPWTIALARWLVRLACRLQTAEEREVMGSAAEYETLVDEVRAGERSATSILWFSCSHLTAEAARAARRWGRGATVFRRVGRVVLASRIYLGLATDATEEAYLEERARCREAAPRSDRRRRR